MCSIGRVEMICFQATTAHHANDYASVTSFAVCIIALEISKDTGAEDTLANTLVCPATHCCHYH